MDNFLSNINKPFDSITITDIENLFSTDQTESNRIEFKSYHPRGKPDDKLKGIISTICAFLNSEGGIIIWGAPDGKKVVGKREKVFSGSLTYVGSEFEHDTLINRIHDKITPLPVGITVRVIGKTPRNIYLFHIQVSNTKPHQFDNKYMIRLDGQSRIAPHYYIESMFKQVRYLELEGYIKFNEVTLKKDVLELTFDTLIFNWSPFQNEKNVVVMVFCSPGFFIQSRSRAHLNNQFHEYTSGGHISLTRRINDILFYGSPFSDTDILCFNYQEIKHGQYAEIILRFGGESAPQKESYYKFIFVIKENLAKMKLIEKLENKKIGEIKDDLGLNKKEILKKYLNR
jgi:hypothetical protein